MSILFAFTLPALLLLSAYFGFRLSKLGHKGQLRRSRMRFRLRNLLLFVTLASVFFAMAQRFGGIGLFELIAAAVLLAWFGLLAVAEPVGGFGDE